MWSDFYSQRISLSAVFQIACGGREQENQLRGHCHVQAWDDGESKKIEVIEVVNFRMYFEGKGDLICRWIVCETSDQERRWEYLQVSWPKQINNKIPEMRSTIGAASLEIGWSFMFHLKHLL